nr:cobalt-precorrin-6A reductase [Rhodococcus sp. HNM0569]
MLLGGTGEARALAAALVGEPGITVTSSLAGRVRAPSLPDGDVRVGGFGGVEGLSAWLRDHEVDALVDATHPFAARITAHAHDAATRTGTAALVLRRPGWTEVPGDVWRRVPDTAAAVAAVAADPNRRVFLTIGRQEVAAFAGVANPMLIRAIDPPDGPLPAHSETTLARGPFTVDEEIETMRTWRADVVVTKDSGGPQTEAKLVAARRSGIPVIVIDRPPLPSGAVVASSVEAAFSWVRAQRHGSSCSEV